MRGYTILLLKSSGSHLSPYDVMLVSRIFTTLGQLVASIAMTRLGRRMVFMISAAALGLGLIGFGLSFQLNPGSREPFKSHETGGEIVYDPGVSNHVTFIQIRPAQFFFSKTIIVFDARRPQL